MSDRAKKAELPVVRGGPGGEQCGAYRAKGEAKK
jgi:hypothetical protein